MSEYVIEDYSLVKEIKATSFIEKRNKIRMNLVEIFSQEIPGTGNGDKATRYTYYVEKLKDGNRVYLRRPANLHNGFDFLVCVENTNYSISGKKRNSPKHDDISKDLQQKKDSNPSEYKKLYTLIKKIYECNLVDDSEIETIRFSVGLSPEHIIKVLKWLFIEQDIRYWNYSGRGMTWGIIPSP